MKIEIMTVSGRIVKEITKEQLGPIHIGNNITTYKWDGTDMFGAKLGNGVYLYRVVTRLNGSSIDKFGSDNGGPNTDMYFKGGYGKMYLMR
jgi:flagellar hook assembly protein FlgD